MIIVFKYGHYNDPILLVVLVLCDTSLAYKHLKSTDVDLHLLISNFVSNLTGGKRSLFELILDMVQENFFKNDTPIIIMKIEFINRIY